MNISNLDVLSQEKIRKSTNPNSNIKTLAVRVEMDIKRHAIIKTLTMIIIGKSMLMIMKQ